MALDAHRAQALLHDAASRSSRSRRSSAGSRRRSGRSSSSASCRASAAGASGPSEQAILADTFPPAKRGMAMAVYGMAVVLAPAIGPTLGGFITDNFSWRWVFFINIPVGHRVAPSLEPRRDRPAAPQVGSRSTGRAASTGGASGSSHRASAASSTSSTRGRKTTGSTRRPSSASRSSRRCRSSRSCSGSCSTRTPSSTCKMFQRRSFAVANALMLILGVALFGSTVLLAAVPAGADGLHGAAVGHGAVAGRVRGHPALAPGRAPGVEGRRARAHHDRLLRA